MSDINIKTRTPVESDRVTDLPNLPESAGNKDDIEKIEEQIALERTKLQENQEEQERLKDEMKQAIQQTKDLVQRLSTDYSSNWRTRDVSQDISGQLNHISQQLEKGETINAATLRDLAKQIYDSGFMPGSFYTSNFTALRAIQDKLNGIASQADKQGALTADEKNLQEKIYLDFSDLCGLEVKYYSDELDKLKIPLPSGITNDAGSVKKLHDLLAKVRMEQANSGVRDLDNVIDIVVMAEILRVQQFDSQLSMISNEMQDRNSYMKEINDMLSKARTHRPADDDHPGAMPDEVIMFMKAHGLDAPGVGEKLKPSQYDQYVLAIKGLLDDNNNESQLQMVKLQRVISYRNQCFEFASNTISKLVRSRDVVVGNIRG